MDVNAIYLTDNLEHKKLVQEEAIQNLKRVIVGKQKSWDDSSVENPYIITDFMETKQHGIRLRSYRDLGQDIKHGNNGRK